MNKNYIIGGALIVGGGLYYAYTKGLLDKFIKPKTPETAKEESQAAIDAIKQEQKAVVTEKKVVNKEQAILEGAKLAYKRSVETLQGLLKVGVDGDAGRTANSQTNKALAATYGLDKGIVSPLNVLYYIKRVENKDTLVARSLAAQKQKAVQNKTINDANKFLELVNRGKYKATAKQDFTANAFVYDALKKGYVNINEPRKFRKGDVFSYGNFTPYQQGGDVMYNGGSPSNTKHYRMNPNLFIVTL